jgi:hypothetical protein
MTDDFFFLFFGMSRTLLKQLDKDKETQAISPPPQKKRKKKRGIKARWGAETSKRLSKAKTSKTKI